MGYGYSRQRRRVDLLPFVLCGIVGTFAYIAAWVVSAYMTELWQPGVNSLSELGISKNTTAAMIYNYGCMISGAMCTCLGTGKVLCENNKWNKASGVCLIFSDIFLFFTGLVDLSFGNIHNYLVYTYMVFFTLAVLFSVPGDWYYVTKLNSYLAIILLTISGIALITQPFAVFEVVGVICLLTWKGLQCIKLLNIRRKYINMEERKNTVESFYHSEL